MSVITPDLLPLEEEKNIKHPTSKRNRSGYGRGFSIRPLVEMVAVEWDFSGKYSFHNLTLLRTKYRLIRSAIGSEMTFFSDAEVAIEGYVQARKNLAKLIGQIFITNNSIDDNS